MSKRKDELRALLMGGGPTPAEGHAPSPAGETGARKGGKPETAEGTGSKGARAKTAASKGAPSTGAPSTDGPSSHGPSTDGPSKDGAQNGGASGDAASQEADSGEGASVPPAGIATAAKTPERATSGAVRAMGLALGSLRSGAEEARALRETMARAEHVVELDPDLIEPAFLSDRMRPAGEGDESFEGLKASIAEGGQEVPILVRPHPDPAKAKAGRYQAAYGHRRIAATRALGLKVRAVVRALTDEALVLAQGKENSERRDLSFIERALFCRAMLERGFERRVAQAALGLHKAEMSRLLQVAEAIPLHIAEAIGPAPRAGRPRWMDLAERLAESEANRVKAEDEMGLERFRNAASDERFTLMLARMSARSANAADGGKPAGAPDVEDLSAPDGARIGQIRRSRKTSAIEIGERDFADYVAAELPGLYARFRAARGGEGRD